MISDTLTRAAFGWTEIALIALVLILLFGAKKIPELMKGLGGGMKEFKKAAREDEPETERPQVENRNTTSETRENTQEPPAGEKRNTTRGN
jgi:sec-independent protein translocase protein TatA